MKKYWIITYGCQMNHSDSERIASALENAGCKPALDKAAADLIVINSCSVRQSAIDRVWGEAKKLEKSKKEKQNLIGILTGCVLPGDKKKFQNKFDLILDIKNLPNLGRKLKILSTSKKEKENFDNYLNIKPKYQSPFTASVPIMTGCNNFCSYCAVPYTRGREISRPVQDIVCEIKKALKLGAKEIWLLGQNVNSYQSKLPARGGSASGGKSQSSAFAKASADKEKRKATPQKLKLINFAKLLKIINDIPGKFWIRFTSPHPKDFSEEMIEIMAKSKKITPYLNLPLQSGDNEILRRMKRPYTSKQYKNLVKKIKNAFLKNRQGLEKDLAISTDAIVGFPGETKKQFENTAKLFKKIGYDMAYISQYSPRPGTAAAKMKNDVSAVEKTRRWRVLDRIIKRTSLENNRKYLGEIIEVLIDSAKNNFLTGKNRNYKSVKIKNAGKLKNNLIGKFVKVKITGIRPFSLGGELIKIAK